MNVCKVASRIRLPSETFYLPSSKKLFFLKKLDNACAILYLCKQF